MLFRSAGAALTIPTVAILVTSIGGVGGESSWRYAIAISGMVAIADRKSVV